MKCGIIYEPKGRAREYAELAANLYTGCNHNCFYCYAPKQLRKTAIEFHKTAIPRYRVLERFEYDCRMIHGDQRTVLLCFLCDPYPHGIDTRTTRTALSILGANRLNATILTKGGMRAARDFDLLKENQFDFGTSISFVTQSIASKYEPGAASTDDRIRAIRLAKNTGIRTWVSVEPVVNPDEALMVMKVLKPWVDYWKIGKLNHHPQIEKAIDWKAFLNKALSTLDGKPVHIKKDLLAAAHT